MPTRHDCARDRSRWDFEVIASDVRRDPAFREALDTVWPSVGAKALIAELLTNAGTLAAAAEGILSPDEQRRIHRGGRSAWTATDRPLLDEAYALIEEPAERYGHIVVDEAQDLSPMALRVIARRSRDGSMTVLGDLAQVTGPWRHRSWREVLAHLPAAEATESELTLGYRVSPAIMDLAARVGAAVAPQLRVPRSVRAEPGGVHIAPADASALSATVARLARALQQRVDFAAIIAPDAMLDDVQAGMSAAGVAVADARAQDLGGSLVLVPASIAKGLEFDGVLLVEPAAILEHGGPGLLYICLTRAMRSLVIAHARELPEVLMRAEARSSRSART